ncbi:hypothetical protein L1987_74281 [Smallanthus sonchifolius]|uniref:Uncharacterized protein n=1 Tax=Smallanthus sonchifolius TaxID=185202 RepID=A0ACB9A285_9ASTR|nr:hypothetical protein L1987_74281 [Smallanthus sonchifolius]
MTDEEHETQEPEVDPEVVADKRPKAPMEAEPKMEAKVLVMHQPSFLPYHLRPGGALFMYTPKKQILPPRKRKLVSAFGEEDTMLPLPPKRARADGIIEDDDTSDEEPPSTFEVGESPFAWPIREAERTAETAELRSIAARGTNIGAVKGETNGNINGSGNGNGTDNSSGARSSGNRDEDTNGN